MTSRSSSLSSQKSFNSVKSSRSSFVFQDELKFLPLGGCGEIGMNLNLYGYRHKWLMVDLGITFGDKLGIDVWMPDPSYIQALQKDLVGLVLTHAHEDHIGAVPYLWPRLKCPIYATPFTMYILREKLKEAGLEKDVPLHEIPLGGQVSLDPFTVEFITLTHSIPEPNALAIRTAAGVVVHTGDWKIDPEPLVGNLTDVNRLQELGDEGVLALVCDSTNVFVKGRTGSEKTVRKHLQELVGQEKKGRVIISCFASNVARLESAALAAQATGRRGVLVGRSLVKMDKAARSCGYLKTLPPFLDEAEAKNLPPEKCLLICTGSQGEPRSALTRLAKGQHPRVKIEEGDLVIFSSRMIPGNEAAIKAVYDHLLEQGIKIITEKQDDRVHVSGHPARQDLEDMYKWVRPRILIPVHGERAHLQEQACFARSCGVKQTFVPRNGLMIGLNPENLGIIEEVSHGRLALDGNLLISHKTQHLKDRAHLMATGAVLVTLIFKKKKGSDLKEAPMISLLGVVDSTYEKKLKQILSQTVQKALKEAPPHKSASEESLIELVQGTIRRSVQQLYGKKPLVMVHRVR